MDDNEMQRRLELVQAAKTVAVQTVAGGDTPPALSVQGASAIHEAEVALLTVLATDAENQHVSLQLLPNSSGGAFTDNGDGTGTFRWATGFADSGVYPLTFRGFDLRADERQRAACMKHARSHLECAALAGAHVPRRGAG